MVANIYDFDVVAENGELYSLSKYHGNIIIVVNTATKCGFAPQFKSLEKLYQKYKDVGLVVLGFPSNQFKQELNSSHEAAVACQLRYGVSFPMHEIISVNGKETSPLFKYLKKGTPSAMGSTIKWNFTKFLIDREGRPVSRYSPKTDPIKIIPDIEKLI